jgi:hypothetical protein
VKNAVENGSGAMIHIPDFMKTGSGAQKLIQIHVNMASMGTA